MSMRTVALSCAVALALTGCAPSVLGVFQKDVFYEKSLLASRKGDIYQSLELKSQVGATDLHAVDAVGYPQKGTYCLGIYLPRDNDEQKQWGLDNPDIRLTTVEGAVPLSKTYMAREHELLKKLPYVNNWTKYYLVQFDEKADKILKITQKDVGFVLLDFSKVHGE